MRSHLREENAQYILVAFSLGLLLPAFGRRFAINCPSHVRLH